MKTFKEIREKWDKDEEKAFANVLFWLAKKGTRGAIKTGRALVRGAIKTGDYLERKVIAILIPGAGIKELQAMEDMGVDIPGFVQTMSRSQKLAWDKANEEAEKD
jgi:hypothetical protein